MFNLVMKNAITQGYCKASPMGILLTKKVTFFKCHFFLLNHLTFLQMQFFFHCFQLFRFIDTNAAEIVIHISQFKQC